MKELLDMFLTFARIGGFTFGGGYAMLPMLQKEVVNGRHWATDEELMDYYAIGQCTPGIIAVNTATFVGYKNRGIPGAIAAMVADWYPDLENETVEEEKQAEGICVFLRLLSGSAANGKPEQVLQAFYESLGLTYRPFAIQVEREELYADEGAEVAPEYVPLEAYGSEIV